MSNHRNEGDAAWVPTWTQAVSDFRGEDDEPPFNDVTVRMTLPASIGGGRVRAELSNHFGDRPIRIGRGAIGVDEVFVETAFDGRRSTVIPTGESVWTDPIELVVGHGDDVVVDLYLPEPTQYATAGGFRFDRSASGDFAGSHPFPLEGSTPEDLGQSCEFPATNSGTPTQPDGTGWSLPPGGPFLRTIEVAGTTPEAVVVGLGGSSTAMGWPQLASALLPADARIAVLNRGIPGNRIRLDAPPQAPSWGRAGLSRFEWDVLGTHGVTHVIIAYNSNDWSLPGRLTSMDEMPSIPQLIGAYSELIKRARDRGLRVSLATVTPLAPEIAVDTTRETFRLAINDWIRTASQDYIDFDAAIRSETDPSRLDDKYAAPDHTHPNINGERRLAQATVEALLLSKS